jgi:thymidylate kinase
MIIIIEGTDCVGKSTQTNLIIKNLKDRVFQKLHYSSLPFKDNTELHITYSMRLYDDMFKLMVALRDNDINAIFDRSHLGETVYSPLYRQYSGDYVFEIEKEYVENLKKDLYLITLINEPSTIFRRDDGLSFYKNEEGVRAEVDGFIRAHRKSKIKNKLLLNVGTMSADEVCTIILNFIEESTQLI